MSHHNCTGSNNAHSPLAGSRADALISPPEYIYIYNIYVFIIPPLSFLPVYHTLSGEMFSLHVSI